MVDGGRLGRFGWTSDAVDGSVVGSRRRLVLKVGEGKSDFI